MTKKHSHLYFQDLLPKEPTPAQVRFECVVVLPLRDLQLEEQELEYALDNIRAIGSFAIVGEGEYIDPSHEDFIKGLSE